MNNCIFCKIINKEIPGKIIYEDDICIAFLDISQTTKGHTLVIPKNHYANMLEVDDETLAHLFKVAKKISNLLINKLNAKGMNILTNVNEVAGQTVMHFHIHLIPRYNQDDTIKIEFTNNIDSIDTDQLLNLIIS